MYNKSFSLTVYLICAIIIILFGNPIWGLPVFTVTFIGLLIYMKLTSTI